MRWSYYREFYPRSVPRKARGGIKAQSKRGSFGQSWWAQRWIAVLESFNLGARLDRGRSYARSGQVLSIDIDKGVVRSRVQGSRPAPYDVTIEVKPLGKAEWKKVVKVLGSQALFAAKLLAGEIPQDIEKVFTNAGLSLFPNKVRDLTTECSCPDWSNPCKHIAAVYYLLGEEFDRDPFLIFKLRGLAREEFLELLGKTAAPDQADAEEADAGSQPAEPLTAALPDFWQGGELPASPFGAVQPPPVSAALPRRLGSFPFWRGAQRFLDAMESVYEPAAAQGLRAAHGEVTHAQDALPA